MITVLSNDFSVELNGLSTDQKPILTERYNGSILHEIDTGNTFIYDAANKIWHQLPQSGGGGGGSGTSYSAGTGIKISAANVISTDAVAIDKQLQLADVAKSGSYLDLTSKPDIPTLAINVDDESSKELSTLKLNDTTYKIPQYAAGYGIEITANTISIDQTKVATLDSVKTMLSDAYAGLTINADEITVKNASGQQVAVATADLITTGTTTASVELGNYVFTEINN